MMNKIRVPRLFSISGLSLLFLLALIGVSHAATYYVGGSACNDSNSGTSASSPWCTIGKANTTLSAGDTVIIRGGTYSSSYINPSRSGSPGNYITYQAYPGETPVLTGMAYAVFINGRSYIKVIGIQAKSNTRMMYIRASSNILIQDCVFAPSGAYSDWAANRITTGSSYVTVRGCTFGRYGKTGDNGVVLEVGAESGDDTHHILIEFSTFYQGGHHTVGWQPHHSIFRNNWVHSENWINGIYGGRGLYAQGTTSYSHHTVIEKNVFSYAGSPGDSSTDASNLNVDTQYNIVRKNVTHSASGPGIAMYCTSGYNACPYRNYVYQNTSYRNGLDSSQSSRRVGIQVKSDGGPGNFGSNIIKNNLLNSNSADFSGSGYTASNNWLNAQGSPAFKSTYGTDPFTLTSPDLHLTSNSGAIDYGTWLTTITSSAGSGTSFTVADAGYFTNGFGIVTGDEIQLQGQTQTATIKAISGNTITVDKALSWTNGQGVALKYTGSKPDAGAYEYGIPDDTYGDSAPDPEAKTPSPPKNLRTVN